MFCSVADPGFHRGREGGRLVLRLTTMDGDGRYKFRRGLGVGVKHSSAVDHQVVESIRSEVKHNFGKGTSLYRLFKNIIATQV